jgi:glycosyltransferase involved in cell wall biosynthesis
MAIYNELETAAEAMDAVLAVDLPDVEIELIVVESNSTDGTRAVVTRYADHRRVTLVLQDSPRGKGNAVREGLRHARGGIILIQDADLEYSVDDYAILLAPIMDGRADFTLGCRHVPGQPIRVMHGNRTVMAVVNSAHWVFLALFNFTYRTHLRDPFTMYKVFRSECIDGVEFVADRFDFDWELVAKLVRLGYDPLEIPIQYTARNFGDGKKVRFFRDPPTWIWACLRFRFSKLPNQARARTTSVGVPFGDDRHLAQPQTNGAVAQPRKRAVSD